MADPVPGGGATTGPVINFDQGLPDPLHFPLAELGQALTEVLADDEALRYFGEGGVEEMQRGPLALRRQVAERLHRRDGLDIGPDGILLVNGSTDGLALCANTLVGPGDVAVVEATTYPFTRRFLAEAGAQVVTVDMDERGMVADRLDEVVERAAELGRPRLVATIPTFHSPTGTVMPRERRQALLEAAARHDLVVLEDNCYYDFHHGEAPPPPLLALDTAGLVVQSDSFSKTIAPGLRMGFVAGPAPVIDALAAARQDFGPSRVAAAAIARYMAAGRLEPHVDRLRAVYRNKMEVAADALDAHCRPLLAFDRPRGGFYLWAEIAPGVDWDAVRASLAQAGVAVRPGDGQMSADDDRRFVRISPIQVPVDRIVEGIEVLGRALRAAAPVGAG